MKISGETLNKIKKELLPKEVRVNEKEPHALIKIIFNTSQEALLKGNIQYTEISEAEIEFSNESRKSLEKQANTKIDDDYIFVVLNIEDGKIVFSLTAQIPFGMESDSAKDERWFEGSLSLDGKILYADVGEGSTRSLSGEFPDM